MSEEEILSEIEFCLSGEYITGIHEQAIKGLLELYNKEKENLKIATAMLTKGIYPEQNEGANDFNKQFISKGKILNLINERKFELQQEFKDFEDDVRLNTLQEIYYMEEK